MQLYVIRHGQKTFSSRPSDKPDWQLTDLGRRQADHVADAFRDIHLDTIISSPLLRALQTATPLALMKGLKINVWRDLVEHYTGNLYIGPASATLKKHYPIESIVPEEPQGWTYKGTETMDDVGHRAENVIRLLSGARYLEQTVALVAHRGFNQVFFTRLFGSSLAVFEQLNGCINHIIVHEDTVLVNSINDNRHIPEAEQTEN